MLSHLWPMVPLAWTLRAEGHDVKVASLPHIAPELVATGLPALAVGEPVELGELIDDATEESDDGSWALAGNLRGIVRWNARMAGLLIDAMLEVVRAERPDVVVHGPMDLAGPLLAAVAGVPAVQHGTGLPLPENVAAGMRRGAAALVTRYGL